MRPEHDSPELKALGDEYDVPRDVRFTAALLLGSEPLDATYTETSREDAEEPRTIWYGLTATRLIIVRGVPRNAFNEPSRRERPTGRALPLATFSSVELDDVRFEYEGRTEVEVRPWTIRLVGPQSVELPEPNTQPNGLSKRDAFFEALIARVG
jgi:hypothetical protein